MSTEPEPKSTLVKKKDNSYKFIKLVAVHRAIERGRWPIEIYNLAYKAGMTEA